MVGRAVGVFLLLSGIIVIVIITVLETWNQSSHEVIADRQAELVLEIRLLLCFVVCTFCIIYMADILSRNFVYAHLPIIGVFLFLSFRCSQGLVSRRGCPWSFIGFAEKIRGTRYEHLGYDFFCWLCK